MQEFECNQDNGTKQNVFVLESDSRVSNGMKRADDDDDDDDVKNISQLHFCIISATRKLYICLHFDSCRKPKAISLQ